MLTPREQGGGLAEASRLLQQGLQLLEERRREVDAVLEEARERALVIKEEAEARAHEITAEAERQRAELEGQVAALRSEVAALREELARLSEAKSAASAAAAPQLEESEASDVGAAAPPADAPHWGRRSGISEPAIRGTRSTRPRWLPPWLPFLLIALGAGAVGANNANGQPGGRPPSIDMPTIDAAFGAASVTSTTTTLIVAATQAAATFTPTASRATATSTFKPTTTPVQMSPTPAVRQALTLPPSGSRVGTPLALPVQGSPQGPIVAAYTMYATYTVQPGDTLNRVATQFGVTGDTIMRSSGLIDPNLLLPGQILTIPRDSGWLYRVQAGDTLEIIALRFGLSADDLMGAGDRASTGVAPGELVFIPDRGTVAKH